MNFHFQVPVTGNRGSLWVKEINYKTYKSIVKALYDPTAASFIKHLEILVNEITDNKYCTLNLVDTILILFQARAVSVGPDIKIRFTCKDTQKEFDYSLPIDNIVSNINVQGIDKESTHKNITVEYSILKARDLLVFDTTTSDLEQLYTNRLVSSIDRITIKGQTYEFGELDWIDRKNIVDSLPAQLSNNVLHNLLETEITLGKNKLFSVNSPFTDKVVSEMSLTLDIPALLQFLKFLFTADLSNLYITEYNLISKAHFTGDFLSSVTPIEVQVYWAYCQQQIEKENESAESPPQGPDINPFASNVPR